MNTPGMMHATGDLRKEAQALLRGERAGIDGHYLGSDGGAGYCYVMLDAGGIVQGVCLIGRTASESADRSFVAEPWQVVAVKRLYCTEEAPLPESALLRYAMADVARKRNSTLLIVSYADPAATDSRTGLPLLGGVLMAAGMLFAGHTTSQRWGLVDEHGVGRSSRQGAITISKNNLPPDWRRIKLPPARIWLTVVAPDIITVDDQPQRTSVRWRKQQRKQCWSALREDRRIAAKQWIEKTEWQRKLASGRVIPLGESTSIRWPNYRRPALWKGADLSNRAAPVWVPETIQLALGTIVLDEAYAQHEQTARRCYLPRLTTI